MNTRFLGLLSTDHIGYAAGRPVHRLTRELIWINEDKSVVIPEGFETDLASVPRLPIIYTIWGNRAHREAVLHDYLYRIGAVVFESFGEGRTVNQNVSKDDGDWYFREAMIGQGRGWAVYHPMYLAVRCAAGSSWRRMRVLDRFPLDEAC